MRTTGRFDNSGKLVAAGTGHRPDKLGGYGDKAFELLVTAAIKGITENDIDLMIVGMALGFDQALAAACIELSCPFLAYIPCKDHPNRWPVESQIKYKWLLEYAQEIVMVSEEPFTAWCMQKRNEAMVDDCDLILAMYDGTNGGTHNCIKYAEKQEKPIVNLYPLWEEWSKG